MIIKDLYLDQSIVLNFSHLENESVFFTIIFITPIGRIEVDPHIYYANAYIGDIENIPNIISDGLKNKIDSITTGCMEPLFDIEIRHVEKDIFKFMMWLDLGKILHNKPSGNGPSISLDVNRDSIEEIIRFFKSIIPRDIKLNCIPLDI